MKFYDLATQGYRNTGVQGFTGARPDTSDWTNEQHEAECLRLEGEGRKFGEWLKSAPEDGGIGASKAFCEGLVRAIEHWNRPKPTNEEWILLARGS